MPKIRLITILLLLTSRSVVQSITFTNDTFIDSGDVTYDGQDIIVNGCTLTVNGVHNFNSLQVINDGVVTHSTTTDDKLSFRIRLTVAQDLTIAEDCKISADGKGYGSGSGPGAGGAGYCGGGGGYGGSGGQAIVDGEGGLVYGSITEPNALGSGGGSARGYYAGGSGGGVIHLTVSGTLAVEGSITANGSNVSESGGGSGGSIYVTAGTLAGRGIISANGGNSNRSGGGGSGGRIAVYFDTNTFTGTVSAYGGSGSENGAAGTIFTKPSGQELGDLLINNGGQSTVKAVLTPLISSDMFNEITVANQAHLELSVPDVPTVNQLTIANEGFVYLQTTITTISNLHVKSGGMLSHHAGQIGFDLRVPGDVTIDSGGSISADGKGYGSEGGPGAGGAGYCGGGGGYGGSGGWASVDGEGGLVYGSITEPNALGSGGGSARGYYAGGSGGGVIHLTVSGTLAVEGSITANGSNVGESGGGSGGCIYVTAGTLAGGGIISANGGNSNRSGGGGGGGRIAVYYLDAENFNFSGIIANGGTGYENGQPGSVFLIGSDPPILISPAGISPLAIDISENETTTFNYVVNRDAQVTIKIYRLDIHPDPYLWQPFNVTRTLVATPANGISAESGLNSFVWDGKDDFDVHLPSGAYAYTIEAKASDGRKASYDPEYTSKTVSLRDMTVSGNFNPYKNQYCEIRYGLGVPAWLDLQVFVDTQSVKRLVQWQPRTTVGNLEIWDGRDDNEQIMGTRAFSIRGYAQALPENAIILNTQALDISSLVAEAFLIIPSYNQISTVFLTITQDAQVTIKIYDPDGSYFKTLFDSNEYLAAGSYEFEWDGTNGEGKIASVEGDYRIEVVLKNLTGDTVTRNANIVVYR